VQPIRPKVPESAPLGWLIQPHGTAPMSMHGEAVN
jgi:hypothetical protein